VSKEHYWVDQKELHLADYSVVHSEAYSVVLMVVHWEN
jgi:hypothetical protein